MNSNLVSRSLALEIVPQGTVYEIPVELIRPYPGQPRKKFDEEGIKALGISIIETGQKTPVLVKKVYDDDLHGFELVDGERRFRACIMCSIEYILAYVIDINSESEQFITSVIANFGSKEHTPLEITDALKRILDSFLEKGIEKTVAIEKVAKIVTRSVAWVYQYLGFLRLAEEVKELMNSGQINFQTGVALTRFEPKAQLEAAQEIIKKKMPHREALYYVRNRTSGVVRSRRTPSKDWVVIKSTINRLKFDTNVVLNMKYPELCRIFKEKSPEELESIVAIIKNAENNLQILREEIMSILNNKEGG